MPLPNYEVAQRFRSGKTAGQSKHMRIVDKPKHTLLVDFDWAVLAKRHKDTGLITYYSGWDRYSRTTMRHISIAGLRGGADFTDPTQLELGDDIIEDEPIKQFRQTYSDVFIDPFTKKFKLKRRK